MLPCFLWVNRVWRLLFYGFNKKGLQLQPFLHIVYFAGGGGGGMAVVSGPTTVESGMPFMKDALRFFSISDSFLA